MINIDIIISPRLLLHTNTKQSLNIAINRELPGIAINRELPGIAIDRE